MWQLLCDKNLFKVKKYGTFFSVPLVNNHIERQRTLVSVTRGWLAFGNEPEMVDHLP